MQRYVNIAYATLVYAFLYFPIVILIVFSFNDSTYSLAWNGFTWRWYEKLADNDVLIEVALNSVTIGVLAASLATVLGTLGAVALYHYDFLGKRLVNGLVFVLIMSPEIVMGLSLLTLFVTVQKVAAFISESLDASLGFTSVLLSHVTFCTPFVIVTVLSRINGFDRHLIEAAKDLGASEFYTFRKVILPLLMPAVVAGWLLSFTLSMDDVIITQFVSGPDYELLPLRIYSMVKRGITPEVNALSAIMFVATLVIVAIAQALLKENKQ